MSRLEMFLENLSLREKFLISLFVVICAFVLAYKGYEEFLKDFFEENILFHSTDLLEKKGEFLRFQRQREEVNKEFEAQKAELKQYQSAISIFTKDYESYLKDLQNLIQNQKIILQDLQSSFENKDYFKLYTLKLTLNGDFFSLLEIIKELEKKMPPYLFTFIEFENITSFKLNAKFELLFLSLH